MKYSKEYLQLLTENVEGRVLTWDDVEIGMFATDVGGQERYARYRVHSKGSWKELQKFDIDGDMQSRINDYGDDIDLEHLVVVYPLNNGRKLLGVSEYGKRGMLVFVEDE